MSRHWSPCRVCGAEHTNPSSSSICHECGAKERETRELADRAARYDYETSAFGQFMSLPENERWMRVFESIASMGGDPS